MQKALYGFAIIILITACGSSENSNTVQSDADTLKADNEIVFDENDYDTDWIDIRESILAADTSSLNEFIESGEVDAANIINLCATDWVIDELAEKPYSELGEVDYNGDLVKEFSAEIIEEFEGEEYGSGIFIYLKETPKGLRVVGILAAG